MSYISVRLISSESLFQNERIPLSCDKSAMVIFIPIVVLSGSDSFCLIFVLCFVPTGIKGEGWCISHSLSLFNMHYQLRTFPIILHSMIDNLKKPSKSDSGLGFFYRLCIVQGVVQYVVLIACLVYFIVSAVLLINTILTFKICRVQLK